MKKYKKYLTLFILSISFCLGLFNINNLATNAASLPHYITSNTWQMQTDSVQGGYSLKTKFNKRHIRTNNKNDSNPNDQIVIFDWKFSSLKKANNNTYYGKAIESEYTKGEKPYKEKSDYKIKLVSNDEIWIIRKHVPHTTKHYQTMGIYGNTIFKKY